MTETFEEYNSIVQLLMGRRVHSHLTCTCDPVIIELEEVVDFISLPSGIFERYASASAQSDPLWRLHILTTCGHVIGHVHFGARTQLNAARYPMLEHRSSRGSMVGVNYNYQEIIFGEGECQLN